jgi:hypothetical protein
MKLKFLLRPICWALDHNQGFDHARDEAGTHCERCGINFEALVPGLIEFPEQTVVIAKDQPEYRPLPAHVAPNGMVTFCWKLSLLMRLRVLFTGKLWHQVLTFNTPLQPQSLLVKKPFVKVKP